MCNIFISFFNEIALPASSETMPIIEAVRHVNFLLHQSVKKEVPFSDGHKKLDHARDFSKT